MDPLNNAAATDQEPVAGAGTQTDVKDNAADANAAGAEDGTLLGKAGEKPEDGGQENTDATEEEAPKEKVVPEKYEIKLGEGQELDQATLDLFTPIFKELGIDNEGAQKLAEAYAPVLQAAEEKAKKRGLEDFEEIKKGWKAETLKTLGADADKKMAVCAKVINTYGSDELREVFDQTGLGNHPVVVRFMLKAGENLKEDDFIDPVNLRPGQTQEEVLNKLYPTMK